MEHSHRSWLEPPEWYARAACADLPWGMFFLDDCDEGSHKGQRRTLQKEQFLIGLRVCQRCPVVDDCLEEALNDRALDVGIRGGMTTQQRRQERRRRARASRRSGA